MLFHQPDRPASLHRREGLTDYLSAPPVKPRQVTKLELDAMSATDRLAYDRQRQLHLSGGIILNTPHLIEARRLLEACFAENMGRNSGHSGLMVSGASTLGKTTTIKALMRLVFRQYGKSFPDFTQHGHVPVVYVQVPPGSTPKLLMKEFADFFGLSIRSSESMVSIRSRVRDLMAAANSQLIVVDELQNLAGRTAGNGESVDLLKNLHNDLAATFVYAGIDLTEGTLLAGPRGQQLAGRFTVLNMTPFNLANSDDRATWKGLLPGFENELLLTAHEPGTLRDLSDYLFERTGGSIGSLARLVTGAALRAITDPKLPERVDRSLMDTIRLDFTAEQHHARAISQAARRPTKVAAA